MSGFVNFLHEQELHLFHFGEDLESVFEGVQNVLDYFVGVVALLEGVGQSLFLLLCVLDQLRVSYNFKSEEWGDPQVFQCGLLVLQGVLGYLRVVHIIYGHGVRDETQNGVHQFGGRTTC